MINVNGVYIISNSQRNGNGPLTINLKKYDYFPGEFVEGNIILHPTTPMVLSDIYLSVIINESWNVQTDIAVAESNEKVVATHRVGAANILRINSALINLNPGQYNFPFKFKLQENFPPCFEYPKNGQRGYLRYTLKAQLYSTVCQGESNVHIFIKTSARTLNSPLNYGIQISLKKIGVNNGTTVLKTSYKQNYSPIRGKAVIDVEIDNTQGKAKVKGINLKLVRRIQYKKLQEAKNRYNLENLIANYSTLIDVPPKTKSQIYHCEIVIKDDSLHTFNYLTKNSNPYPRLTDLFFAMPSLNSYSIKCDYFIVASLEFAGLVTQNDANKIAMPIFLYHIPTKANGPKIIDNDGQNAKQNMSAPAAPPNVIQNNNINLISSSNVTINEVDIGGGLSQNNPQQNNIINQNQMMNPQQNIKGNQINQNQMMNPQQNIIGSQTNQNQMMNPQQNITGNQINQNQMMNPQQNIIGNQINQNQMMNPQQNNNFNKNQMMNPQQNNNFNKNQMMNPQQNNNIIENEYNQNQAINPQQNIIGNQIYQNQAEKIEEINPGKIGENNIIQGNNNEFNLINDANEGNKMIIAANALSLEANNNQNEEEDGQKIISKKKKKKIDYFDDNCNNNLQSKINDKSVTVNRKYRNQKGRRMFTLFDY